MPEYIGFNDDKSIFQLPEAGNAIWEDLVPPPTEAYAVFDSADGSLVFFRDDVEKYTNGQTEGTKTYYTGIETRAEMGGTNAPWYSNRASVQSVTIEDAIKPKSTAYWFTGMNNTNFTSITGLDKLDTSSVTSMNSMFNGCRSLTSLDVSHFDTSSVTSMGAMFDFCLSLTSLDVSRFDTSSVTNMAYMFGGCKNLTSLDVSHFDTSSVTNMAYMFDECTDLTSLDVSHFDTSSVTNMASMFSNCSALTSLDVSHFNTSNVTEMDYMFYNCVKLTSLDVSHFDTSKVTNTRQMFYICRALTTTLNIMNMPSDYTAMCRDAATESGAQITLKYISPVTSANIDTLVATKSSSGNVVNGGQGTFVPPTPPTPPTGA